MNPAAAGLAGAELGHQIAKFLRLTPACGLWAFIHALDGSAKNSGSAPTPTPDQQGDRWMVAGGSKLAAYRALKSLLPTASRMLLGCQATERMVDRMGFLICLETHQSCSSSKWQTETMRDPLPTANLSSAHPPTNLAVSLPVREGGHEQGYHPTPCGENLTQVAARLMRRITSVGFHRLPFQFQT